jgi:stearoyl-CoA desaturase (delta-9 desaturase)
MSVQGGVLDWVADHRKHHAHTDREGDPHTPHGHGGGVGGTLKGLWHAHAGWLFESQGQARWEKYARELYEDPTMKRIHKSFELLVGLTLLLPFALGFLLTGTLHGALTALLWGGVVRIALLHHITWSVNSVCHFFGRRRFDVDDHSTNVWWLAVPSLGEAWHHNHHAFPRAAKHGLGRFEVDVSGWVIEAMKRVGLAWEVVEIAPERQAAKRSLTAAAR